MDALSQPQLDTMQLEYGVRITEVMPGSPAAVALAMDKIILPELSHLVREARR